MSNLPSISGDELISFLETVGCNKRHIHGKHTVMWSIFTGKFFIIPTYDKPLNENTMRIIIWNLGITNEAFEHMWDKHKNRN